MSEARSEFVTRAWGYESAWNLKEIGEAFDAAVDARLKELIQSKVSPQPVKWEYTWVVRSWSSPQGEEDYYNELGQEGWELCYHQWFKRPVYGE